MFLAAFVLLYHPPAMSQNQPIKTTRHRSTAFYKINSIKLRVKFDGHAWRDRQCGFLVHGEEFARIASISRFPMRDFAAVTGV
ncbi:MAG: hypothetical protein ACM3TN_00925 [Alphaproteobacteria bacterium]